jgi:hypothetical protein
MAHDDDETFTARLPNGERVTCRVKRDINTNARRDTFKKIFEKAAARDDGVTDIDKANRGRSGPHDLVGARVRHLHDALDRKRERHGYQKSAKDHTMDTEQHLDSILKDFGPIALAKYICDSDRAPCTEGEFVAAVAKAASEQHPDIPADVAFAKLYEAEETVRRACGVLKAAPFVVVADLKPAQVGGADARDVDSPEAALAQLAELGRRRWPTASAAQQFTNAFTDPANAKLAQLAHQRPKPTTAYAFPSGD